MKRVTMPHRKSLLDIVQENLRAAGKITFVTRVAYFGEYVGIPTDLEKKMEDIINDLKRDYVGFSITGLMLVYPQYYIHVLEAPEVMIYKHFKMIYDDNSKDCKIGKTILLPCHHHVLQGFFNKWFHVHTIPPTLLDKLEAYELEDIQKQISNCLVKLYTLCDYIINTPRDESTTMTAILRSLGEKGTQCLPESTVLEFLLRQKTAVLLTIDDYVKMHSSVPYINLYNGKIYMYI